MNLTQLFAAELEREADRTRRALAVSRRLNDATVPAIDGPSADDQQFA